MDEEKKEEELPLQPVDAENEPGLTEMNEAVGVHIGVWILVVVVVLACLAALFASIV